MKFLQLIILLLLLPLSYAHAAYENNWRIQCSGNAESAGTIVFELKKGWFKPAQRISIDVALGTSENNVSRRIRDVFRATVGKDYKVESDDGEDVLVKNRWLRGRFSLKVAENSVRGVRLNLDQE